jgi:hypothetical protein
MQKLEICIISLIHYKSPNLINFFPIFEILKYGGIQNSLKQNLIHVYNTISYLTAQLGIKIYTIKLTFFELMQNL